MNSPRELERETRVVDGTTVVIVELVWPDGGRSWDVRTADGYDLTMDGSFDAWPTDEQVRTVLACTVCGGDDPAGPQHATCRDRGPR